MENVISVLSWVWYNFFDRAAMFMMVLVLIGQLLTKRPVLESIMGALKAYIGYIVYQTATGGLYNAFQPIMMGMRNVLGMNLLVNDDSLGAGTLTAILEGFGRTTSLQMASMAAGFIFAILLVLLKKYTKCRSLIIQAHILSGQAIDMVPILLVMFPLMNDFTVILAVGLFLAVKWCVLSNLTVEPAQDLTDGANMCVGHTQMILDRIGYEYGRYLERKARKKGKEVKKFDNMEMPGFLSIFNDMYVSSFIVMLIYFAVLISLIGKPGMMAIDSSLTESTSFALYIFHTAGKFPVYLVILLTGMRMFVAELTVAFSGISEKILPNTLRRLLRLCNQRLGHYHQLPGGFPDHDPLYHGRHVARPALRVPGRVCPHDVRQRHRRYFRPSQRRYQGPGGLLYRRGGGRRIPGGDRRVHHRLCPVRRGRFPGGQRNYPGGVLPHLEVSRMGRICLGPGHHAGNPTDSVS